MSTDFEKTKSLQSSATTREGLEQNKEIDNLKCLSSDTQIPVTDISPVWEFFNKDESGHNATCKACSLEFSCLEGDTGNIRLHLQQQHREQYLIMVGQDNYENNQLSTAQENSDKIESKHKKSLNEVERQLTEGVAAFWKSKAFSDVEIHCGVDGGVVQAHRLVLAAISPFLRFSLQNLSAYETEEAVLLIPDVNSEDINNFLDLVCSGSTDHVIVKDELSYLGFSLESLSRLTSCSNQRKRKEACNTHIKGDIDSPKVKNDNTCQAIYDSLDVDYNEINASVSNISNEPFMETTEVDITMQEQSERIKCSPLWNYFIIKSKLHSVCTTCSTKCKTVGENTSGLVKHLRNSHPKLYKEFISAKRGKVSAEKETIKSHPMTVNQGLPQATYGASKSSLVWNYFTPLTNDRTKCNSCEQEMRTFDGSTSGMLRHLRRNHEDLYNDWKVEKDRRHQNTLLSNNLHPIWNYFEQTEPKKYKCLVCTTIIDLNEMEMILLEEHLKQTHEESFKEYANKLTDEKFQTEYPDSSCKRIGVGGFHGKFSRVWEFYEEMGSDNAKCKECGTILRVFSNSTSGLLRHIKRHHDNLYQEFNKTRKKETLNDPNNIDEINHPIWLKFQKKDKTPNLVICNECHIEIELADSPLPPLENHLKDVHKEIFELYHSGLETFSSTLISSSCKVKKTGIRSAIWQYFKRTENRNLNECCICRTKVCCNKMGTSNMIRHLERYHASEYENFLKENSTVIASNGNFSLKTKNKSKKKRGPKPKLEDTDPSERTCSDCGKSFSGRAAMRFHQRVVHSGIRPFKCEECGMTFARGDSFKGHTHSKTRSFLCTICGKTFGRKNIRDQHERAHRGDRRYNCNFCKRKFMTNQQKMNHERVHTGEKPYQCTDCGRQFAQQHQLTTHYRIHTGEKPYGCPHCTQKFRHLSSRNNHKCEGKSGTIAAEHTIVTSSDLTTTASIANATIQWVESD